MLYWAFDDEGRCGRARVFARCSFAVWPLFCTLFVQGQSAVLQRPIPDTPPKTTLKAWKRAYSGRVFEGFVSTNRYYYYNKEKNKKRSRRREGGTYGSWAGQICSTLYQLRPMPYTFHGTAFHLQAGDGGGFARPPFDAD
jgi:hypothetical protein